MKRLGPTIGKINGFEARYMAMSDAELQNQTVQFKERIAKGEPLDSILPEAFAVCREGGRRVLNMRHYDVQLIGGMVLHNGRIAEMKTGEGKTLVATLPAYLNALTGKGVVREDAYRMVQRHAMETWDRGGLLRARVLADAEITAKLSQQEIDAAFSLDGALRHVDAIFERTLAKGGS